GMSELDVESVELLPGASSALYGANAFNGIMFMRSKNPFDYQGISFSYKDGLTSQDAAGDNKFYDVNIRMAHVFSNKFAAKATLSYLEGTEWFATDYRNTNLEGVTTGDRNTDNNYDGLNVYGDEVSTTLPFGIGDVSRTGYDERDLMSYKAKSMKFGASLNYRPLGDDRLEIIWNSKFGNGNTIYQGTNRYNIKNFFMEQHKLEVRGKNFFVRGYMTSEDAGDSYDTRFAAININREWKSDAEWFQQYAGAFLGAIPGVPAGNHQVARAVADTGRLIPGTPGFQAAFDKITTDPDLITGSKFQDNTKLYHADANLNLRDYIDWAEVQVGGSYRRYSLNSNGSIFTDYDGPINYDEFGIYTQIQKSFLEDDRLKLTSSVRYDKAQNFDGNYSPRVSLAYAGGENKNQNFRASFQTGFRNPTTQDQYIGLNAGRAYLVGSAPDNLDRFNTPALPFSPTGTALTGLPSREVSGREAYENAFSLTSVLGGAPTAANVELVKAERVSAYEIGYRGLVGSDDSRVTVDLSVYYNQYQDFIAGKNVVVPYYGDVAFTQTAPVGPGGAPVPLSLVALSQGDYTVFSTYTNTSADINSYGASIGLTTKIFGGFNLGANYTYAKFDFDQASDPDFEAGFNTPEHKVKIQFGKQNVFKNFGFNINARWQDEYRWESTFLDADIASRTVIDAQINYSVPAWKSVFKVGGANLTGQEYLSA
ncbi:MAG: TonB-dependent receptor, partial [Polaribacter sp.]|nr:TonB-dependent receptor [Polaribacter sp.]